MHWKGRQGYFLCVSSDYEFYKTLRWSGRSEKVMQLKPTVNQETTGRWETPEEKVRDKRQSGKGYLFVCLFSFILQRVLGIKSRAFSH